MIYGNSQVDVCYKEGKLRRQEDERMIKGKIRFKLYLYKDILYAFHDI